MFKSLKEKLSKFFKKTEEKEEEIGEKPKKEKVKEEPEIEEKKEEEPIKTETISESETAEEESNVKDSELKKEPEIKVERDKEEKVEELDKEKEIIKDNKEELEHAIESIPTIEKEKPGFFSRLKPKFGVVNLNQSTFNEFFEELEQLLLENNVSLSVVDKIREDLEKELVNLEIKKSKIEEEIKTALKNSINEILLEPYDIIKKISEKKDGPFVILFFGINGSGKTTTISKLAYLLKEHKIPTVLAAGDTFRAASIEQLKKHGEKLEIKVINQDYGSDPAAVGFDAVKYAKAHGIKAVLIDTAGRMHTKDNLLKEMEKIIRVVKPDLKIFVAEAITGNDATEQAKIFNETFGIDGSILTKADVDERGGTTISIGYITKKPILFLGTGQGYKDLEPFSKNVILAKLGLD